MIEREKDRKSDKYREKEEVILDRKKERERGRDEDTFMYNKSGR